ncbi:MAG TPA: protein kinase, partial [Polyangiaceae bacterium]
HAHNVVHRNLKPTNLFLTRREGVRRVAVLDFGVSEDPLSDIAINLGGTHGAAKALSYLAPEQIREPASVDARADIWALGAILHEMLTGCVLHEAQATPALLAMIAADPPVPLTHLRPDVPPELESVVLRAIAKDREGRYSNLPELAEALRPFASEEGQESIPRIAKVFGRRSTRSIPPPLPGAQRAIVHVARPPAKAPAVEAPRASSGRRWTELALTGAGLFAAGALGVFFAVHTMESALVAAITPRTVVADLSPALPAAPVAPAAAVVSAAPVVPAAPVAPVTVAASVAPSVPAATPAASPVAPQRPRAVAPVTPRRAMADTAPVERAVVADAKPVAAAPARATGLFDDAN